MYKRSTISIVAIILALLLATMFVCIDEPYTNNFWIEIVMLYFAGVAFGTVSYRLYDHSDSTVPLSIVGIKITSVYLCFVVLMAFPVFLDFTLKTKYFVLVHAFGLGVWMIAIIIMRIGRHAIDAADKASREISKTGEIQ